MNHQQTLREILGKRLENLVETDQMMKELQSYKFDPSRYDPTGGDGFVRGDWREVEDALMDGILTDEEYEKIAQNAPVEDTKS